MRRAVPIAAILAVAFVMGMIMPNVAGAQANFPAKDTESTQTVGMVVFWVHPQYRTLVESLPGWDAATKRWTVTNLQDLHSKIAYSNQHLDDDFWDLNGTAVGDANTLVSDSDFIALPTSGFNPGSAGTKEVHTEIWKLSMEDSAHTLTVRAGPGAGITDIDKRSIGEVEAKGSGSVFPAESFFNVFVEIDTPFAVGTGVLYNKAPLIVVADSLQRFPPRVVYTHSGTSEAVPIFFKGHRGPPFGHLILAGHGVNVPARAVQAHMKKEKPLKCGKCKDKKRPRQIERVPPGQVKLKDKDKVKIKEKKK
jgi:hypothetical protein